MMLQTNAPDDVEWEKYPIYAPTGANVLPYHLVRFISQLPTRPIKPGEQPTTPGSTMTLMHPFTSSTRLCTPRHRDTRSRFINRKKLMKTAQIQAQSAANLAAAAGASGVSGAAATPKTKEVEEEGVDPDERKWRLEDAKQAKDNKLVYLGMPDPTPKKEIHQQTPNHYALLVRQEGKFMLVPVTTYSFRHSESDEKKMTLEEAEQKMKTRLKRFEKRMKSMATMQALAEEENAAAGGGGAGGTVDGILRARPASTTKQTVERVVEADGAFDDTTATKSGSKSGALTRAVKAKREEGADYTRTFDDDDIDGNDDRLDGQGGEASDEESDDEEVLVAEQQAVAEEAAAIERKKAAALQKSAGMTMDEAEEDMELQETAEDMVEDEPEDALTTGTKKEQAAAKKAASGLKKEDDDDSDGDEFDDSDLSLDDESDDEEQKDSDVKMKVEPAAASRKRPISPATDSTAKKMKTEVGATPVPASVPSVTPTSTAAPGAAAPADLLTPAKVAEIERVVIAQLCSTPPPVPGSTTPAQYWTSKSLAKYLNDTIPLLFNRRTAAALGATLRKVASILPDKTHIILKKEYQTINQPKIE